MKLTIDDLAAFGGAPEFSRDLHVGRPNIGNVESFMARVAGALERRWLTNDGPLAQEFEQRIADHTGVRHCIALTNATIGLEIATRAAGFRDEVIVPSFTFVATAHALQWQGITPVFCDVSSESHNLDPARIEAMITPRTSGIVAVHLWGRSCDIAGISEVAERHGLPVIYDAAHAFGSSYRNRSIAQYGTATVLSFHATKFLNAFEGGAVLTNDDALAERVRLMKNFGFLDYDQIGHVGTNGKMHEASAAMGLTSLEAIGEFLAVNRRNYERYRDALRDIPGIELIRYDESETNNFQYVVLEIDRERAGIDRDAIHQILQRERVLARRYFYPGCHNAEPYRSLFPHARLLLPVTERLAGAVLALPTGTDISVDEIDRICAIIRFVVDHSAQIGALHAQDLPVTDSNRNPPP